MRDLERDRRMPRLGEHVMLGGLPCLVIEADAENGSITLQPLEDLPEEANNAFREVVRAQNGWWLRSPRFSPQLKGSLYDGDGNLRPITDVLNEMARACGWEGTK